MVTKDMKIGEIIMIDFKACCFKKTVIKGFAKVDLPLERNEDGTPKADGAIGHFVNLYIDGILEPIVIPYNNVEDRDVEYARFIAELNGADDDDKKWD